MAQQQTVRERSCRVRVVMPDQPVTELSPRKLADLIASASRAETQITALRMKAIAELTRREGPSITEKTIRHETGQSTRQTKQDMKTARKLQELPATRKAFEDGDISYRHAEVIARSAEQAPNINESDLVDRAKHQPTDIFTKTARRHVITATDDEGMDILEKQRRTRTASIRFDPSDGMTVLYARFDPITGALVKQVISQQCDQMWRTEHRNQRPTPGQRMADALAELITGEQTARHGRETGPGGGRSATLLLIADYDTVTQQVHNLRLGDNTPLPTGALTRLACDARIIPAFFDRSGQPLWLGRTRRIASPAQRIALIARDRGCIGCNTDPSWCQAHHIIPWSEGGPTDLDNMALVCSRCHHKIHDENWQITHTSEGKLALRPP